MDKYYQVKDKLFNYIIICISIYLAISLCFFKGLYFQIHYLPAIIIIGLLFLVFLYAMYMNKEFISLNRFLDFSIIGLLLSYLIAFIFGSYKSDAFIGVLKYMGLYMTFKMISIYTKKFKLGDVWLLRAITFIGFLFVCITYMSVFKMLDIQVLEIYPWGKRLSGLLQYSNTTAVFLGVMFLLNISILSTSQHKAARTVHLVFSLAAILSFWGARSRGALIVFLAAWAIGLLLFRGINRLSYLLYSIFSLSVSLFVYSLFDILSPSFKGPALIVLIVFILLSICIEALRSVLFKRFGSIKAETSNKIVIGFLTLLCLIIFIAVSTTEPLEISKETPQKRYEIYAVKPQTQYIMDLKAESASGKEKLSVVINSIDNRYEKKSIYFDTLSVENKITKAAAFKTQADTSYIMVYFVGENLKAQSQIFIDECKIKEKGTGIVVDTLKLKNKFIPEDVAGMIQNTNIKTGNAASRMTYYKDGFKIFRDHWLIGAGAGAWGNLYKAYQESKYISKEPHSYYVQVGIETGILGLISLFATMVLALILLVKLYSLYYRKADGFIGGIIGIFMSLFLLLGHALIDFDFSFYGIMILLFILLGIVDGLGDRAGMLRCSWNGTKR